MEHIEAAWNVVRRRACQYGPYLMLEVFMPGGTLLALALYLYRMKRPAVVVDRAEQLERITASTP